MEPNLPYCCPSMVENVKGYASRLRRRSSTRVTHCPLTTEPLPPPPPPVQPRSGSRKAAGGSTAAAGKATKRPSTPTRTPAEKQPRGTPATGSGSAAVSDVMLGAATEEQLRAALARLQQAA